MVFIPAKWRLIWFRTDMANSAILFLVVLFLTAASISHTVALRYSLLLLLLVLSLIGKRTSLVILQQEARWPICALITFLFYALWHSAFLSHWSAISLSEVRSQLLVGSVWFLVGILIFRRSRGLSIVDLSLIAGCLFVLLELFFECRSWLNNGYWPYMESFLTDTKLELTFFLNLILTFLAIALCFKNTLTKSNMHWSYGFLCLMLVGILFVSLRSGARNGLIGIVYLSLSVLIVWVALKGRFLGWGKVVAVTIALLIMLAGVVGYDWVHDDRNQVLWGSIKAGWNYTATQDWLTFHTVPTLSSGKEADASAYFRVAWIHAGLDLIEKNLMGYGYGKGAFARAWTYLGQKNQLTHSHSGIIDLGVGLGVPGLVLWLLFCVTLIWQGMWAFIRNKNGSGLILVLVTTGFLGRMMIESIQRDHMLYLFLFLSAALLADIHRSTRRT